MVKVYLNNDRKILDSVKVNAGLPTKGKSWTVPCYVLKKTNVQEMSDEEAYVTVGPLHPFPTLAPYWSGPVPPTDSSASPANSNAGGSNMVVDGQHRVVEAQDELLIMVIMLSQCCLVLL